MIAASFIELVARMLISLGCVLALIGVAYIGVRRSTMGKSSSMRRGTPSTKAGLRTLSLRRGAARRHAPPVYGMKLLSRIGLGRSSSLVAVQFGENVYLVASSDTAPTTVLAQAPLAAWQLPVDASALDVPAVVAVDGFLHEDGPAAASLLVPHTVPARVRAAATGPSALPTTRSTSDIDGTRRASAPRRSWLDVAREATVRQA